jgi:hypothetical protein
MTDQTDLDALVAYLERTRRLSRAEVRALLDEVLTFLGEPPEDFIRRRHLELQRAGCRNDEIYVRIAAETAARRFRAPAYSERQIRRIIYG